MTPLAAPGASSLPVDVAASSSASISVTETPNTVLQRTLFVTTENESDGPKITVHPEPSVLQVDEEKELNLIFLGCEAKPPYGPFEHTASLFLDLLDTAVSIEEQERSQTTTKTITITLQVYHASLGFFPSSEILRQSDGIILPGSFNSAYDSEPWIERLKEVIQNELVAKELPTLGVCFGHQLYAHSFSEGFAVKCPAGPQAGRRSSELSAEGLEFFNTPATTDEDQDNKTPKSLDLFYTHGDMVEALPSHASAIGGNDKVPIQAAFYRSQKSDASDKIVAVTFQAHPEYASSREKGLELTLQNIVDAMKERGDITEQEMKSAKEDAVRQYDAVREHSVNAIISAGQKLEWFS